MMIHSVRNIALYLKFMFAGIFLMKQIEKRSFCWIIWKVNVLFSHVAPISLNCLFIQFKSLYKYKLSVCVCSFIKTKYISFLMNEVLTYNYIGGWLWINNKWGTLIWILQHNLLAINFNQLVLLIPILFCILNL